MKIIFTFCHDTENNETVFSGNVKITDALRLLTNVVLTSFEEELGKSKQVEENNQEGLDK